MYKTVFKWDIETSDVFGKFDVIIEIIKAPNMATPSSYTDKDIEEIEKYKQRYPNARTWTTLEGLSIPFKLIKDDHLKNIKKFMDKNFDHYGNRPVYKVLNKEWKKRFITTSAGEVLFGKK